VRIRPVLDRIVVKREEAPKQTPGGIILPDTAKEKPVRGVVVAIGPGALSRDGGQRLPMEVQVNDVVAFGQYAGSEIEEDGEKFLVLNQVDVLAVVG
jgi:chaperonin GroES